MAPCNLTSRQNTRGSKFARFGLIFGAALVSFHEASAQTRDGERLTRLPALDQPVAATDDTRALVTNPANLAFIPSAELRWSAMFLAESARASYQGHAFALGFPLPLLPGALGLRLDAVAPPAALGEVYDGRSPNYRWFTVGYAAGSRTNSLGVSWQRSSSSSLLVDNLTSWSLGYTQRPLDQLAVSVVAHDLNAPRSELGLSLHRSFDFGLAIRPDGTDKFELGLEAKLIDAAESSWMPRATLGIGIPNLGRIEGEFSVRDMNQSERDYRASASLVVHTNVPGGSSELSAGTVFGTSLGRASNEPHKNIHTEVATRAWRETRGVPEPAYALRVRIEDTGGARAQVALLRALWYVAEREPSVKAVVFELRTSPGQSMAHVQELRDAVYYLRQHGKRVLCHLEDASASALYLCAAADRVLVNPAGGIRFSGMSLNFLYFKGLLDKLGVRADFVRIGDHKSAPEALTRTDATKVSRQDHIDLLQQLEFEVMRGLAHDRKLEISALRQSVAKGPFIAPEAKAAGLVDGFSFDDQLQEEVRKLTGEDLSLVNDSRVPRAPEAFGSTRSIAMIYVDGDMVDGRSSVVPGFGIRMAGSYTISESIKQARENPEVAAVVLRIETGGGSAMGADVIWRELALTNRVKPVIVSMGGVAASGGYYIAAPARRIFANPLSITGSIGIFYGKVDVVGLMEKIGLSTESYQTTPRANPESIFRPFSPDERQALEVKVEQFYDTFLSRVAEGRDMEKSEVDQVAQGRVWTGRQAQARGLVDELGGLRQALRYAQNLAGLPPDAPIVELPPVETTIIGRLLGIEGVQEKSYLLPPALLQVARSVAPLLMHESDKPLAKLEVVPVVP